MPEVGGGTRLVTQPLYLLDFHLTLVRQRHYCRRLSVQHDSEPCRNHMAQWGARAHKTAEENTVLFHANVIATRRATAGNTCALGAVHSQTRIWTQSGSSSWSKRNCWYKLACHLLFNAKIAITSLASSRCTAIIYGPRLYTARHTPVPENISIFYALRTLLQVSSGNW